MAENLKFEHDFLNLKREGMGDRTPLGSITLGARCTLFWALGFASLLILGVVFVHVDQRIISVMDDWRDVEIHGMDREVHPTQFLQQQGMYFQRPPCTSSLGPTNL